jgi:hypothetical protein
MISVENGQMKVAIVVEPRHDELSLLARKMPIWVVESVENKSNAVKIWAQRSNEPQMDLTTFKVPNVFERLENCLGIIDSIELHHTEMSELLLIGVDDTENLRQGFRELGYLLESDQDGLLARKISN